MSKLFSSTAISFVGAIVIAFGSLFLASSNLFSQGYDEIYKQGEKQKVSRLRLDIKPGNPFDCTQPVKFLAKAENIETETSSWDFGDGSSAEGLSTSHVYSKPGLYNVSIKVKDKASGKEFEEKTTVLLYHDKPVTYYVSEEKGADSNDGFEESKPLKDLAKAIWMMKQGDTLIVLPGTYELGKFVAWCTDKWKNKMFLGPDPGSASGELRTIIKGKDGLPRPIIKGGFGFNQGHGVTLEHLEIEGGSVGCGNRMTYRDCEFHGPGTVYGVGGVHNDSLIENCHFHDIRGGPDAIGIYITGHNNIIRGCFFNGMGQHAINSNNAKDAEGKPTQSRGWIIENNKITNCNGHGIGLQNVADFIIRNNLIVNVNSQALSFGGNKCPDLNVVCTGNVIYCLGGYFGVFFINDVSGVVFENNIVVHKHCIDFKNPAKQLTPEKVATYTFRNNLYFNPDGQTIFFPKESSLSGWWDHSKESLGKKLEEGSIQADPIFVAPPQSGKDYFVYGEDKIDLRLKKGSPAIGKGIHDEYSDKDISGKERPKSGMNIGAYQ